jgi:hypothetical protein
MIQSKHAIGFVMLMSLISTIISAMYADCSCCVACWLNVGVVSFLRKQHFVDELLHYFGKSHFPSFVV